MLSVKDKKILYELDLNARQTNKQIAKKVGLSEQVTGYKIKSLIQKGIINNFYIKTNSALLDYMHFKILIKLQNITNEQENNFIKEITKNKNVFWVAKLRGHFDLFFSIVAKNMEEFTKVYDNITKNYYEHILERQVNILEKAILFSRGYLLNKEPIEKKYGGTELVKLDEEDYKILKILSNNARLTALEISKKLNVSVDKIIYRIKKLIKNNFIVGASVNFNRKKLGINYYLILLRFQNLDNEKYNKLITLCKKHKHVLYISKTIGSHDIEIETEVFNEEELDNLIKQIKDSFFNELKDYDLLQVKEEYKLNYFPF